MGWIGTFDYGIEEEGEYGYISDNHSAENGKQEEHHIESGVLYQSLGETGENEGISPLRAVIPESDRESAHSASVIPLCGQSSRPGGCAVFARGSEGTHRRPGGGPRYSHVPSGNVCVGLGTAAAYVSPFAPEVAGVLVGVFLAARC
jgi:hypothetical protein